MAHFVDTMAFVGQTPWHRLGTYLGELNVSGKEMLKAAGLDWKAVKVPVEFAHRDGKMVKVPGQYTITRDDTGDSLGCTVGERYEPFQNSSLFEFGEALRAEGDVRWHTAGSLLGGRKIWGLAQLAGDQTVTRRDGTKDVSAPFILLHNTHDGTSQIRARLCSTRVVCWNTLSAALGEAGAEFTASHTGGVEARATEAATLLGLAAEVIPAQTEMLQRLSDSPMTADQMAAFGAQLLTGKDDVMEAAEAYAAVSKRSKTTLDRKIDELLGAFKHGLGNKGDSKLDGLNAVTEYIDHQRNRATSWKTLDDRMLGKRFDSSQFGTGEKLKNRALRILTS